ncbi:unnamed protein product, partial [Callosobruchus maculatus]
MSIKIMLERSFINAFWAFVHFASNLNDKIRMFFNYMIIQRYFRFEYCLTVKALAKLMLFTRLRSISIVVITFCMIKYIFFVIMN